ncbi:hypothetical protein EVAR_83185_1 [Eumeta japonica]|uniref:Uncharacterized protein n=1 Tax=Eumeta variegata TaxID=151549 RepID=A0A4C2A5D2_EUMVA|nr:hypothetical protein EVAR_83185_1 [Eumeta japonica]
MQNKQESRQGNLKISIRCRCGARAQGTGVAGRSEALPARRAALLRHYNFQLTGHIRMTDKVQRLMVAADMLQLEHAPRLALTTWDAATTTNVLGVFKSHAADIKTKFVLQNKAKRFSQLAKLASLYPSMVTKVTMKIFATLVTIF